MKQVVLVNGWLNMPIGKLAAQVSHASMSFLANEVRTGNLNFTEDEMSWLNDSFTKIILLVRDRQEWENVKAKLDRNDVKYKEIIDKGLTVFNGVPTHTCTGFRPMTQEDINKYFGSLPLLK